MRHMLQPVNQSMLDRLDETAVTTTAGESWTYRQAGQLAYLIYVRFGRDMQASCEAWERLLQNSTPLNDFASLASLGQTVQ